MPNFKLHDRVIVDKGEETEVRGVVVGMTFLHDFAPAVGPDPLADDDRPRAGSITATAPMVLVRLDYEYQGWITPDYRLPSGKRLGFVSILAAHAGSVRKEDA